MSAYDTFGNPHMRGALTLEGMTHEKWISLPATAREKLRDNSNLSPQLIDLEGWRVEVVDMDGEKRRFNVGESTGWRPCHLEMHNSRSLGGAPASKQYQSVSRLRKVR